MRRITQWRPHNLYDSMLFKDLCAGENVQCAIRLKRAPAMRALAPPRPPPSPPSPLPLTGSKIFTEYPSHWILSALPPSYPVLSCSHHPILHTPSSLTRQLNVGRRKLPLIKNESLRRGLEDAVDEVQKRVDEGGDVKEGEDYVVWCKRV